MSTGTDTLLQLAYSHCSPCSHHWRTLQPCYSGQPIGWKGPGDKPRVAQTEQTCGSLPAGPPSAAAHAAFPLSFSFSPATMGLGRARDDDAVHQTTQPRARARGQPGRTPAQQHQARALASSSGPPPAVSQSPPLLRERSAKQAPSPPLRPSSSPLPPFLYHVAGPSQSFSSFRACHSSLLDQ